MWFLNCSLYRLPDLLQSSDNWELGLCSSTPTSRASAWLSDISARICLMLLMLNKLAPVVDIRNYEYKSYSIFRENPNYGAIKSWVKERDIDLILELPIRDEVKSQSNLNKDSELPLVEFKILSRFLDMENYDSRKWKWTLGGRLNEKEKI